MYEQISARRSVPQIYEEKLKVCLPFLPFALLLPNVLPPHETQSEGILDDQTITSIRKSYKSHLEAELARVPSYTPDASALLRDQWAGIVWPSSAEAVSEPETGVKVETLKRVGSASVHVPEDFVSFFPRFLTWYDRIGKLIGCFVWGW